MKKTLLAAGAVVALSTTFAAGAAENDKPQYLSDWWHQSVNVVGSYHTRFGPQIRNDTYLEYEGKRYLEQRFPAVYGDRTAFLYR